MATLEAYERFIANEPEAQIEYRTIEAYHPSFNATRRWIFNFINKSFPLESEAPRNPGETVLFEKANGQVTEPSEQDDGEQQLTINLGGVDGELNELISSISGVDFLTPIEIVYRKYFSGDLSEPATTPLHLQITNISFENINAVTIVAEDANLATRKPGQYYLLENFKGLA